MGRIKGIKNNSSLTPIVTSSLTPQERIQFLANLIIDRILEDQNNGQQLRKKFQEVEI
jgi:hypothetical protein